MSDAVIMEVEAGVVDLRLNRPDKRNAVDSDIMCGLLAAIETIKADKSLRVVVLSGEGKGFCSGAEMTGQIGDVPIARHEGAAGDQNHGKGERDHVDR